MGLGETFFGARAVEAYLHESAAMTVLGRDPLAIEHIGRDLTPYIGFAGTGAETRGRSAVDIALWDLFDHGARVGRCRDRSGTVAARRNTEAGQ